jgi:hypothetical protein
MRAEITQLLHRTEGNHTHASWCRVCATAGAAAWAALAVAARTGILRIDDIGLMFLFAPLVIVPLGIELGRVMNGSHRLGDLAQLIQPLGAAAAVVAIALPPGRMAALLACGWLLVCLLLAAARVLDFISVSPLDTDKTLRATLAIAAINLVVGGAWLVASRLGMRPLGIQDPIGLLTAVHFHFAGFATATIAAATLRFAEARGQGRWLKRLLPMVVGTPFLVAAGFVISPQLKMAAALLLSASVMALAIFLHACGPKVKHPAARLHLRISAGAVFAGMVLAGAYALADFFCSDVLTIPQMARTHGVLNAVGFCLPGLLGWLIENAAEPSVKKS